MALNCALRNGDAHLKNFGAVYDAVEAAPRLAPIYDLVTTSVYLPKDALALTLNGTTQWPAAKDLKRLGETRAGGSPARIRQILERIADAIAATSRKVRAHGKSNPEFRELGQRMLREWAKGVNQSIIGR